MAIVEKGMASTAKPPISDIISHPIQMKEIAAFCQRWNIRELALFGSVLRDNFRPDGDIDVLVSFEPGANPVPDREQMRAELEAIFQRSVDIMYRRVIERDWIATSLRDIIRMFVSPRQAPSTPLPETAPQNGSDAPQPPVSAPPMAVWFSRN